MIQPIGILIAEDHSLQAALLKRLLETQGYEVAVAANGRLALEAARARPPTLVISDVQMQEMDGYALCSAIKADPALRHIPVMLVTALSHVEDIAMGLACGADNFVRKPYDQQALLARIGYLLANHSPTPEITPQAELEITLGGKQYVINPERRQIIGLLLSSYEEAVQLNHDLQRRELENNQLNLQLQRSAAELRAANRELEAFSYSVSHDLRAPLTTIDGFGQLLERLGPELLGDKARHYVGRIRSGTRQMADLIHALLALAQVSRAGLARERVDLSALAHTAAREEAERAPGRAVRVDIEPGMSAQGDPALITQLLVNLLANAFKFTQPQAQPVVRIATHAGADGRKAFCVSDNGVGFDMAQAGKLFGAFQRLHPESEFPGTGIGLATVQRIVARHGGWIRAESMPGEGASFIFTLATEEPA